MGTQDLNIYSHSKDGLLIGWGNWVNGVLTFSHRFQKRDGGLTVIDDDIENGRVHSEDVASLNKQGDVSHNLLISKYLT